MFHNIQKKSKSEAVKEIKTCQNCWVRVQDKGSRFDLI